MAVKLFTERRSKDYVWRTAEEEFHPDCIDYARHPKGTGLMFWAVFRKGKMGPGLFFDLEKRESVKLNSLPRSNITGTTSTILGRVIWRCYGANCYGRQCACT